MSPQRVTSSARLVVAASFYVLAVALTAALWGRPGALVALQLAVSALVLWRWHSRSDVVFYFLALVLGPLAEMAAIAAGAWSYTRPFWLIPLWLPPLWGVAAVTLKQIAETLAAREA